MPVTLTSSVNNTTYLITVHTARKHSPEFDKQAHQTPRKGQTPQARTPTCTQNVKLDPLATLKDGSRAKTRGRLLYENETIKMALARKRGQSRHKFAPVSRPTHAPAKLKRGGYLGVLTAISKSSA